jgi:hypothetical protein
VFIIVVNFRPFFFDSSRTGRTLFCQKRSPFFRDKLDCVSGIKNERLVAARVGHEICVVVPLPRPWTVIIIIIVLGCLSVYSHIGIDWICMVRAVRVRCNFELADIVFEQDEARSHAREGRPILVTAMTSSPPRLRKLCGLVDY